jgi:DNA-cytosine methyltransferase
MKRLRAFSLFSGVGGFEIGIQDSVETIGFSEIDKYASMVLRYKYPNITNYGDCTKINWSEVPDFDLLTGGSPCQDFSIAGKRAGIEGKRSGLVWEYIRCLEEKKPRYFIFENVKGLLSSGGGRHFATILTAFSEAGYSLWWQVLNAKDFGVPQNRERIFVVGYRTDVGQPPEIDIKLEYEKQQRETNNEKMYLLQKGVATYAKELLLETTSSESQTFSREQMQRLLKGILQGIQTGESEEVVSFGEKIQHESEGNIYEVGEISAWLENKNNTQGLSGVVSAPTEEMLLLWDTARDVAESEGQVQQQVGTANNRPNGLIQTLRERESGTLLLSVQPYKERLFYSLGNGKDWQNIYQSEMATV